MLPDIENINTLISKSTNVGEQQTQTFNLIIDNNCIGGKIDGVEALKQSIYLRLSTEADQYIIYSYLYGLNTLDLLGKPSHYITAILPNRIKKTLLYDERITDVTDFEFAVQRNKINCKFIVHTIYGDLNEETEVIY